MILTISKSEQLYIYNIIKLQMLPIINGNIKHFADMLLHVNISCFKKYYMIDYKIHSTVTIYYNK